MAGYDSQGFVERLPGFGGQGYVSWQTAAGSQAENVPDTSRPLSDQIQRGTVGSTAVITPAGGSLVNADVVQVGPLDTLVPRQADQYSGPDVNVLGGASGDAVGHTGVEQGAAPLLVNQASPAGHPNNMNGRPS
jgi:hypothetical protein